MVRPGTRIGNYFLEERLGGASAEIAVFRALSQEPGAQTAVVAKVLLCADDDAAARDRFCEMARPRVALAPHPNVVRTLSYGVDQATGAAYTIQEYVPGRTFERPPEGLTLWHRVRCGLEAARALEHLHAQGVSHGGAIRAKHFRIGADQHVKLVDLGQAYAAGVPDPPEPGKIATRAPDAEILRDVAAYGAILKDLLGAEGMAYSVTLRSIVESCLMEDPAKRLRDLKVAIDRLQAWLDAYPQALFAGPAGTSAKPVAVSPVNPLWERVWTYSVLTLSVLAVAGATMGGAFGLLRGRAPADAAVQNMTRMPSGFYIDRAEVSVGEYATFARRTRRRLPSEFLTALRSELPAVHVTQTDAEAYCQWAGKHLPTVAEWQEAAAQSSVPAAAAAGGVRVAGLVAVMERPEQIEHLQDNVAEWTSDRAVPSLFQVARYIPLVSPPPSVNEHWGLILGGSYLRPLSERTKGELQIAAPARYSAPDVGFRCVYRPGW